MGSAQTHIHQSWHTKPDISRQNCWGISPIASFSLLSLLKLPICNRHVQFCLVLGFRGWSAFAQCLLDAAQHATSPSWTEIGPQAEGVGTEGTAGTPRVSGRRAMLPTMLLLRGSLRWAWRASMGPWRATSAAPAKQTKATCRQRSGSCGSDDYDRQHQKGCGKEVAAG